MKHSGNDGEISNEIGGQIDRCVSETIISDDIGGERCLAMGVGEMGQHLSSHVIRWF
jgi:hypothetical protein